MKKINVTDEQYQFLTNLSKELRTQSNRVTANPRYYAVQSKEKVCSTDPNQYENRVAVLDGEDIPATIDGIKEVSEYFDIDLPNNIEGFQQYEIDEFFEKLGYRIGSWREGRAYQNAFLTEKACQAHIKANHYHYSDPVDYLFHAFRNPELEQLIEIIKSITEEL